MNTLGTLIPPDEPFGIILPTRNKVIRYSTFCISYLFATPEYGNHATTALVLNDNVFLILNGDHRNNYSANSGTLEQALKYFLSHLDQANDLSEHLQAVGLVPNDPFDISTLCKDVLGSTYEDFCNRVREFTVNKENTDDSQ